MKTTLTGSHSNPKDVPTPSGEEKSVGQQPGKTKIILNQSRLKEESENPVIRDVAGVDFYISPLRLDPFALATDFNRSNFKIKTIKTSSDEAVDIQKETIANFSSLETEEDRNTTLSKNFEAISDQLFERYSEIRYAYRQECMTLGGSAFLAALSRKSTPSETLVAGKTDLAAKLDFKTGTFSFEQDGFSVRTAEGEPLFRVAGSVAMTFTLEKIEKSKFKEILEKQKALCEKNLIPDVSPEAKEINNQLHSKIQLIDDRIRDEANYPTRLYRLQQVEVTSRFLRDVMLEKTLPDVNDRRYEGEITKSGLSDNDNALAEKIEELKKLWEDYKTRIKAKIEEILQKKLPKTPFLNLVSRHIVTDDQQTVIESELIPEEGFSINAVVAQATQKESNPLSDLYQSKSNANFSKLINKYKAAKELTDALSGADIGKSNTMMLDAFKEKLGKNRGILAERRNPANFFRNAGKDVVSKSDKILSRPNEVKTPAKQVTKKA